jgi:xylulokinase
MMNLLGIDAGTTGCKVALFSPQGEQLAMAYREYDIQFTQPGRAELNPAEIWQDVQDCIREVIATSPGREVCALSVSSLGEAFVPVSADRKILGPSILNFDNRGEEFIPELKIVMEDEYIYSQNGNSLGNQYSLTKLKWIKKYQPELYEKTYKFLHIGAFIGFMLGVEPMVDYSLANRTLLFDIRKKDWSNELLNLTGLDREKLPQTVSSGTQVGFISRQISQDLGLPNNVAVISGAHDQCTNAVGCGVINPGSAVYGMGTYHCITPVFESIKGVDLMLDRGLNTEHHAVPDRYVCFIYNLGGSVVKWYRDTFASLDHKQAVTDSRSVYPELLAEMPNTPSNVFVLPHFAMTGSPHFIPDSVGVMTGLRLETTRGEILKGILEGTAFYLREVVDLLPDTGIRADDFRVVGGGSKSDLWIQICANIFGRPFLRPVITEAGALGAAIIAGVGSKVFSDYQQGVNSMVRIEKQFDPDPIQQELYNQRFAYFQKMWPIMADYLRLGYAQRIPAN